MASKDFIAYTPTSGSGGGTISVTASSNEASSERSTSLSVKGENVTKNVSISQEAKPKIGISYSTFDVTTGGWNLSSAEPGRGETTTEDSWIFYMRRTGSTAEMNCIIKFNGLKGITSARSQTLGSTITFGGSQAIISCPNFGDTSYASFTIEALDTNSVKRFMSVELQED